MDGACGWCGESPWDYKCSTCDPRCEKKLCVNCSMLWHSRGFARGHQLTSRFGLARSYLAWGSNASNGNGTSHDTSETEAIPAAAGPSVAANGAPAPSVSADGTTDIQAAAEKPTESEKSEADEDATAPKETQPAAQQHTVFSEQTKLQDEEEDEPMEEFGFEAVGESMESGEDADTASIENNGDLEEKAKEPAVEKASKAATTTAEAMADDMEPRKEQHLESDRGQENKETPLAPVVTNPTPAPTPTTMPATTQASTSATTTAASAASASVPSSSTTRRGTSTPVTQPRTERSSPTSKSAAPQVKLLDLEKLLRWFPTTDHVLMEMLAARVESALVIEDALICARIGKCEDPTCRSLLLHYEHCKRDEICSDPKCFEISIVYRHRRACLKKDTDIDGKKTVCPFCIRIRQRRSLGVVAALDHLISDQRRALQSAHSEANRNFCLQSINTWTRRKQLLRTETDRLNQLAIESSAPIFNFPKYRWHFSDAVLIKREPTPLEMSENTTSESFAAESSKDEVPANELRASTREEDDNSFTPDDELNNQEPQDTQDNSIPGNVNFNADFINELLQAKIENGESRDVVQREFDGVMELGYAIVDASFCAPSKAQRCLLNCTSILVHLQHHLDLQVCNQPMCTAVEHHFAHLSQCKAREESESCEYCLRVEERQLVRSVDFMEAQQPEAEAKVQKIINDITASFTNHRPDEREQEVIQLEDELEQAEDSKRELTDKLGAARHNLRKVRKNLERRAMSTSGNHRLPVHFIKVRRGDGSSGSSSKKRRLLGSLD
ncbi:hypothetical protein PRIC1_013372 [Phytophthora ramorum]